MKRNKSNSQKYANQIAIIALLVSLVGGYSGVKNILSPRIKLLVTPRSIMFLEANKVENLKIKKSVALLSFSISNIGRQPFSQLKPPPKVKIYIDNKIYDLNVNRVSSDIFKFMNKDILMIYNGLGAIDFGIQNPTIDPGTSKDVLLVIESFKLSIKELEKTDKIEINVIDSYGKMHKFNFIADQFKVLSLE
ncbi:MAG: hypothetical protein JXJ22_09010 [Bacteroidales bacterium]|nr:hypothetical protein [Bacteroidales bacterium]